MITSLDHVMWFHGAVCMDRWQLFTIDSPWAGGARGFTRGSKFSEDGRLVAGVAQEGLMRRRAKG